LNSLASSSMIDLGGAGSGDGGRDGSERAAKSLQRSRWMTLVWGVVLGSLGLLPWGPVLEAGLTIASITGGAMLGVFLLGTWNRWANETGALAGFASGLATVIVIALKLHSYVAWTWYVLIGTVVTFAVGSLVSIMAKSSAQTANS
jgi:SSS family solute:Na+ symporter